jgi:DNA-binding NarL/FixJ family response regulator
VLIVDDHPVVRQGVAMLIGQQPDLEVCGEAEGLNEAMRLYNETSPHLVIIDISLKDGSGLELVKEIHARNPNTKMLISSMHDEELFAERMLRAGAHGYVHKQEATERIIDAARQILEGRVYLSEPMSERLLHRLVSHNDADRRSTIESLSDRELEVFEMIGRGLTTRQIASRLELSPKTIETYRENIKMKLCLENSTALTKHAVQWTLENS